MTDKILYRGRLILGIENCQIVNHSVKQKATTLCKSQFTFTQTYVISFGAWLFETPAFGTTHEGVKAGLSVSDPADDEDPFREKLLSGNEKVGEKIPLLEPLTLGVRGREWLSSSIVITSTVGFSSLMKASGLKAAEKAKILNYFKNN